MARSSLSSVFEGCFMLCYLWGRNHSKKKQQWVYHRQVDTSRDAKTYPHVLVMLVVHFATCIPCDSIGYSCCTSAKHAAYSMDSLFVMVVVQFPCHSFFWFFIPAILSPEVQEGFSIWMVASQCWTVCSLSVPSSQFMLYYIGNMHLHYPFSRLN